MEPKGTELKGMGESGGFSPAAREADKAMIRVELWAVSNTAGGPLMMLRSPERDSVLPVELDAEAAQTLDLHRSSGERERFRHSIEQSGLSLLRAELYGQCDERYQARLIVESQGASLALETPPEAAVALATQMGRPCYVSETLFEAGLPAPFIVEQYLAPFAGHPAMPETRTVRQAGGL